MKRMISIFTALGMALCLTTAALAAETYSDIYEAFSAWDSEGYPDYVASVSSTDGSGDALTVLVTSQEGAQELQDTIADTSALTLVVDEDAIPYNTLYEIQEEIIATYMTGTDSPLAGCGIGWYSDEDGQVTGFGSTGLENRVTVDVLEDEYETYKALLEEQYGDAVYVLSVSGYAVAEDAATDAVAIAEDEAEADDAETAGDEDITDAVAIAEDEAEAVEEEAAEEEVATEETDETVVDRVTSMSPAEWVVAILLFGLCGVGYYMMQRRK